MCLHVQGPTETLVAEEGAPKDTSHSAVKAIKSRLARSRKVPGASLEVDEAAEMEPEGSERQLQASIITVHYCAVLPSV